MLRALFGSLSRAMWAQRLITGWGFAWRMASRFVAGETHDDAIRVIGELNQKGIAASLDHLGENTTRPEEARQAAEEVRLALQAIERAGVRSNVSIKLSQFGLLLDENLCRENLASVLEQARSTGNFVRIDMEDSTLTQRTLDTYVWARQQGFDNVGIVLQAYLYRTVDDLRRLSEMGARIRLCKGAYHEQGHVAYPRKADVDAAYDHLAEVLLESARAAGAPSVGGGGCIPPIPAIATHDDRRVQFAQQAASRLNLPVQAVEYQMLYGIRRDLQESLAAGGYPVRVYVPYGTHWYPYFMRRLAERPENLWFFLSNFVRK